MLPPKQLVEPLVLHLLNRGQKLDSASGLVDFSSSPPISEPSRLSDLRLTSRSMVSDNGKMPTTS